MFVIMISQSISGWRTHPSAVCICFTVTFWCIKPSEGREQRACQWQRWQLQIWNKSQSTSPYHEHCRYQSVRRSDFFFPLFFCSCHSLRVWCIMQSKEGKGGNEWERRPLTERLERRPRWNCLDTTCHPIESFWCEENRMTNKIK